MKTLLFALTASALLFSAGVAVSQIQAPALPLSTDVDGNGAGTLRDLLLVYADAGKRTLANPCVEVDTTDAEYTDAQGTPHAVTERWLLPTTHPAAPAVLAGTPVALRPC